MEEAGLGIDDIVAGLRYGIDRQDAEQELLERMGRVKPPTGADKPIRVSRAYCRGRTLAAVGMALGQIAGVAAVWEAEQPTQLVGIGGEASLKLWEAALAGLVRIQRKGDRSRLHAATVAAMRPQIPSYALPQRQRRIRLLAVQHKVCLLYPALRIMRPGGRKPGEAEVWLRPSAPGLVLGGVVWVPGYYEAGLHFVEITRCKRASDALYNL